MEERILQLQEIKRKLANDVLTDEDSDDVPLVRLGRFATFSGELEEAALDSSMTVPGSGK